jgi:hypothetical protein
LRLQAPAPYRKTRGLKARREELGAETPEEHEALSDEDLELLVAHVREVIAGGDPPTRKALVLTPVEYGYTAPGSSAGSAVPGLRPVAPGR